jgi:predicted dehydrogenase
MKAKHSGEKIRYAVVGLGHIAQVAVLPAFKHARSNSRLVALISGDAEKLKRIGDKYNILKRYLYSEIEECFKQAEVDAIYIATPNPYHRLITETAAKYGIHVLCEKPLAVTTEDCLSMIRVAKKMKIELMVAYRHHFGPANMRFIKEAHSKRIGDLKIFNSTFTFPIKDQHNIRLEDTHNGGGPLYDIGVYCINSARSLFKTEPLQVFAMAGNTKDTRFKKIDEVISCILKFSEGRMATFSVSFGAFASADIDLIGTRGRLKLEHAYQYNHSITLKIYEDGKITSRKYPKENQFASEIIYFSDCIHHNKKSETSGEEGMADIKIIEALLLSLDLGSPINLEEINQKSRSEETHKITRPSFIRPKIFNLFSSNETKH